MEEPVEPNFPFRYTYVCVTRRPLLVTGSSSRELFNAFRNESFFFNINEPNSNAYKEDSRGLRMR